MGMSQESFVLETQLKKNFDFDDFMSDEQKEATQEVFKGESDVFINLRPGGGKSICFQLPAVLNKNQVTIVFVPRNSLGKNQVDFLERKNIKAKFLRAGTGRKEREAVLKDLKSDNVQLKFLYVSAEKTTRNLINDLIIELCAQNCLSFIVFDEVHCISKLSHDYIPNYSEVAKFFQQSCPNIRKIAVTGTATREVRYDIFRQLGMKEPKNFYTSDCWMVRNEVCFLDGIAEPYQDLKNVIEDNLGSLTETSSEDPRKFGIIFCRKKAAAKGVTRKLRSMDIPAVSYHGDLEKKTRESVRERWIAGKIRVIAVTPNFAVDLHRKNIRLIVHWSMPMSIQQLHQDTGKGTQDEENTLCRVYSSSEEEDNILMYIKSLQNVPGDDIDIVSRKHRFFQEVIEYCFGTNCRNASQLSYFGGKITANCDNCDACCDLEDLRNRIKQIAEHHLLMKKKLDADFCLKQILASNKPNNGMNDRSNSANLRPAPRIRQISYMKLVKELLDNYNEAQPEIGAFVGEKDIPEIARQLEYSLLKGACNRQKYQHDVFQLRRVIKNSSKLKLASSHLKFHRVEKNWINKREPSVIDLVDDDNKYEQMDIDVGYGSEIKTCSSELKSAFGKLQLHQAEKNSFNNHETNVNDVVDNENEEEQIKTEIVYEGIKIKTKSNIESVVLIDDSSSGSETE